MMHSMKQKLKKCLWILLHRKNLLKNSSFSVLCLLQILMCITGCTSNSINGTPDEVESLVFIKLSENPSTGYLWEYEIDDTDIIELKNSNFIETNTDPNRMGAPGIREFCFQCKKAGTTYIVFTYKRPWETNTSDNIRRAKISVSKDMIASVSYVE